MANVWLVEPANGVEVGLSNLQNITTLMARTIKRDSSQATNKPLVVADNPLPHEYQFEVTELSDFENQKRKLSYMIMSGLDILCVMGPKQEAMLGAVEMVNPPESVDRLNLMGVPIKFVGKGKVIGHMREAEDATLGTGAAEAADVDASEGSCVQLNAQNEEVYFSITQSVWALPLGNYRMYIRAKDTAQVADDCTMTVYSTTDSANVATGNKTLTASYAWYSLDFTLDTSGGTGGETGDSIKFQVKKNTATANTLSIDMIVAVMI